VGDQLSDFISEKEARMFLGGQYNIKETIGDVDFVGFSFYYC